MDKKQKKMIAIGIALALLILAGPPIVKSVNCSRLQDEVDAAFTFGAGPSQELIDRKNKACGT